MCGPEGYKGECGSVIAALGAHGLNGIREECGRVIAALSRHVYSVSQKKKWVCNSIFERACPY